MAWSLSEHTIVKFNLARGFRAPNIAELSSNGVHEGTFRYEYGNTLLRPETTAQVDLGAVVTGTHLSLELASFYNHIHNFVYIRKLSSVFGGDSIPDVSEGIPAYQFAQRSARLFGGETAIDVHPHPLDWLHLAAAVSVVLGEYVEKTDSSKYLPFVPPPRVQLELKVDLPASNRLKSSTLNVDYTFHSAQNRFLLEGDTESATPAYGIVGVSATTTLLLQPLRLRLIVVGENLLDIAYQDHLSRLKYAGGNPLTGTTGVYNMGRSVLVKLIALLP
jgi:iron complex outermembrane receptor protein